MISHVLNMHYLYLLCISAVSAWHIASYQSSGCWQSARTPTTHHTVNNLQMSMQSHADLQKKLTIFNTATKRKELFESQEPSKVSFYSCGPTVYNYAHIGNFRAFLTYDLVKRWLEYCGYSVDHVCNLTDVDDKIIIKMAEEGKSLQEITRKYSEAFFADLEVLNIKKARIYPKATEYIKEMESMISKLMESDHAYSQRGSVYYRVSAFKSYGEFAGMKFDEMIEGAGEVGPNERRGVEDKESQQDFALWKSYNSQDLDVFWDTKFGRGRPGLLPIPLKELLPFIINEMSGWHIECSAMCCSILGDTIDIHAGGIDLVFPHHQNEIAQSEAYTGKKFSRYWIHNGFVNINNVKMSKSLKNFKTLRDIAITPLEARAFRFLVVTSQYRNSLNFSPETLQAAINSLKRIDKAISRMEQIAKASTPTQALSLTEDEKKVMEIVDTARKNFEDAMCDDMNTPKAISFYYIIISQVEKSLKANSLSPQLASEILDIVKQLDSILGILYTVPSSYFKNMEDGALNVQSSGEDVIVDISTLPSNVIELANRRIELKNSKNFEEADKIRQELLNIGYVIKDKKGGAYDIYQR